MGLEVPISFTLDTVCPWTYLARKRLSRAISKVVEKHAEVKFTVRYLPYQLYPNASQEGEDKHEWYRRSRYGDTDEKMGMYQTLMDAYGAAEGIRFKFTGIAANTLHAHRMIYHVQQTQEAGVTEKLVESLYQQYFEQEKHPSSHETLLEAANAAGMSVTEARVVVEDRTKHLADVKALIKAQAGDGVDSVPYVVIEGKKRDFTLVGAREVEEYVKTIEQCIKESS